MASSERLTPPRETAGLPATAALLLASDHNLYWEVRLKNKSPTQQRREKQDEFGRVLAARMQELQYTPKRLALELGVDPATTRNWVRAKASCGGRFSQILNILFPNLHVLHGERVAFIRLFNEGWGGNIPLPLPPERPIPLSGKYLIGGEELEIILMDFRPSGYSYDLFESSLVPWVEPPIPPAWADRYELALKEAREQMRKGEINDNPIVALRQIVPSRTGSGEPPGFLMAFSEMRYIEKRAAIILYNKYLDADEKAELTGEVLGWQLHPNLSRCLNVQVAVITSDWKFMFSRRSSTVINGGKIACGIAETMEDQDKVSSLGRHAPDVFKAAIRGLEQEAGIRLPQSTVDPHSAVKFIALAFDTEYYEPQFIGVADFRNAGPLREETRAEKIQQGLLTGAAKDRWENREIIFADFSTDAMMSFLAENKPTDYGLLAAVLSLQHEGESFARIEASYRAAKSRRRAL